MTGQELPVETVDEGDHFLATVGDAIRSENWDLAREASEALLERQPEQPAAYFVLGLAAYYREDLALAATATKNALELDQNVREFAEALAVYYALAGDVNNSLYHGKLAVALKSHSSFNDLVPEDFPKFGTVFQNISEAPLLERAKKALAAKDWKNAEDLFRQHLAFKPEERAAHLGLAAVLQARGQQRPAVEALRAARHVLPFDVRIASQLGNALATLGAFAESRAVHRWAAAEAPDDPSIHASALIDDLSDPDFPEANAAAGFKAWGRRFGVGDDGPPEPLPAVTRDQLTIGYFLGAQGMTPAGIILSSILTKHDIGRFQTVGFGFGTLSDDINLVFQKCMDRWHDISAIDPITVKAMVAAEEVDIVVDACGFAAPSHLIAFGSRMAPCQVAWMGSPAGTGLAAMDYMLTDRFMVPGEAASDGERPAFLELGGVVAAPLTMNDTPLAERQDDSPTFAADANLMEVNPRTVACWARVLHGIPAAKLILRDYGYQAGETLTHLLALFGDFGLAHRVDVVEEPDPGRFFEQADVALMPLPLPRAQVAVEALWAGAPVACPAGKAPHTRHAASLIHHLGLDHPMVAEDTDAYVSLAIGWMEDAPRRRAFRASIRDTLRAADSLNPTRRARDLEATLETLWRRTSGTD